MARDTFIFRKAWGRAVKKLSEHQRSELLLLFFSYEPGGVIDTGDPQLDIIAELIAGDIDKDAAHYEEVCKRRSDAAIKRWSNANAYKSIENMQMHANVPDMKLSEVKLIESDMRLSEVSDMSDAAAPTSESYLTAIRAYFTNHEYKSSPEEFYREKSGYKSFPAAWEAWADEWEAKHKPPKVKNAPTAEHYYKPGELDRRAKMEMASSPPGGTDTL